MENSPRLYSELVAVCGQAGQWRDVRHLQTLAWMVVGLIQAECVKLTAWIPFVHGPRDTRKVPNAAFAAGWGIAALRWRRCMAR
jgi:hypothetical protein